MRILHVIGSVDPANGGPIEGVRQLGTALQSEGHTVEIASMDAPSASYVHECPLPVHALGPGRGTFGYSQYLLPWLKKHARGYDAVIVDGLWQFQGLAVWRALRRSRTPYFVFAHGMLDPWFKRAYPLKHLKKYLYWPIEYCVLRDARGVCFTCEEERLQARLSFQPYRCREIVVAFGTSAPPGQGADRAMEQRELFLQEFPTLRGHRLLTFLGRIHPKKGCDMLLEAFANVAGQNPDFRLVMAGPDQVGWKTSLEKLARERGIAERLIWTGMLVGEEKWGALRASEAFVLPSHQENFGIAVAEALACGVPVLISDKVNIWREIQNDGAGLVESDTVEGATNLLRRWLTLSHGERAAMAERSERCFRNRFEIQAAARSLLQVLKNS